MRTTIDVADDVLAAARSLATERRISLGAALSELARRGLRPRLSPAAHGLPVFDVAEGAEPITPEGVASAMDEP